MNNQAFSTSNFQSVWAYLERSGNNMLGFDDDVDNAIRAMLKLAGKRNQQLKQLSRERNKTTALKEDYRVKIENLKSKKDIVLEAFLQTAVDEFSASRSANTFKWRIEEAVKIGGADKKKQTYRLPKSDPKKLLLAKQLEWNLKSAFRIQGTDRHQIVRELIATLSSPIPAKLIKTDVAGFFESVPHNKLLNIIAEGNLLSQTTVFLVRQLLSEYGELSQTPGKGFPRGIGISAKLAEIYLSRIDRAILEDDSIFYYARFVDDIIFAVPQSSNSWGLNEATAEKQLTSILGKYGLNINSSKTKFMKIDKNSQSFAFLGYDICVNNHNVSLQISSERINRYKKRIKSSFDVHHSKTGHNQAADALLLNRIRFLSANTRLRGSKRNVFAGIYFSNPDVSSIDHLRALTLFTNHEISKIENPTLAKRLRGLDFGANYTNKKIFLFTDETLKAIPKAWSNEE